jgi:glucose-1-phosphate thymidylyltransferase
VHPLAEVEAVVLAAGQARRLRPLSELFPKAVLPIDGRPAVAALLRELAEAGAAAVTVVVGEQRRAIEMLLGDGSAFSVRIRYVPQPAPEGSAQALRLALEAGARAPLVVAASDTLFRRGDPARLVRLLGRETVAAAMTVRRRPPPGVGRPAVSVRDGRVLRVRDGGAEAELSGAPLWGVGERLVPFLSGLPGPPFELAAAIQRAVERGEVVAALEIGPTRDLTFPEDLLLENFDYLSPLGGR